MNQLIFDDLVGFVVFIWKNIDYFVPQPDTHEALFFTRFLFSFYLRLGSARWPLHGKTFR